MNKLTLLNISQVKAAEGSPQDLESQVERLYEEVSQTLTKATEAMAEVARQSSDLASTSSRLSALSWTTENDRRSASETVRSSADASLTASRGKIVEAAQWIAQFSQNLEASTQTFGTSEELSKSGVEAIQAHAKQDLNDVHTGIRVLDEPYYDSAGHMIGRSTVVFQSGNYEWKAPADPNPEGPPKFPYFICNPGQTGPVRFNSYAGEGEGQPEATWETCSVAGDEPFKFIWQFRTHGSTVWKDFGDPGGTGVSTGHNKIHIVDTVSITTPYWKLGEAAWTTSRSSKITIKPHSRDDHGVTHIFDVRCLVVNQATTYQDASQTVPVTGFATSALGSLYSKDETQSCCWIFMEAYNGSMPNHVRECRDEFAPESTYRRRGYRRMSRWLIPAMRQSLIIRKLVDWTMIKPMTAWGGWYKQVPGYGLGFIFRPVVCFWFNFWSAYGRQAE